MNRMHLTPIEDYITEDFGEEGTPSRMEFEARVDAFITMVNNTIYPKSIRSIWDK